MAADEAHDQARTARLRAAAALVAAGQAAQLVLVADLLVCCRRSTTHQVQAAARPSPGDLEDVVADEVAVALGISRFRAQRLVSLADRLVRVMPEALGALRDGRIDLPRVQVLAEATEVLDDATAQVVQRELLSSAGSAPWEGPSPRAWKARVERAVVRADADSARRRHLEAVARRSVRTWSNADGTAALMLTAGSEDVGMAEQVITALAQAWPQYADDGTRLTMDQRRCDSVVDLFRRVGSGEGLPRAVARRDREVGIVLHADTLLGEGASAQEPGEWRGLGGPSCLDPATAAEMARADLSAGHGTRVLLVDRGGRLTRGVRVGRAPAQGWTRAGLVAAVQAALPGLPPLGVERYSPGAAIVEHVRTAYPRCTGYDCGRSARHCDIDHDESWPRGPTHVSNLNPKCRRHHRRKTQGIVQTVMGADGTVTWSTFTGLSVRTPTHPLPGRHAATHDGDLRPDSRVPAA